MKKQEPVYTDHKYLQVAEGLEKMIEDEVLRIGDKLPSVRVLSEEYGISMGTAFQAYYHLEGRGLIEARPKSGYYVRFSHKRFPGLPELEKPEQKSHEVSIKEMINSIYGDIADTGVINFALAVPDPSLTPSAKINKSVVSALRTNRNHCIAYEHTQGNEELRQQVSKLAFNWGGNVKASDIIITNGCLEAVMLCIRAVASHGDTIAVEAPTYFGIYQAIESMGLKVIEIASDGTTGLKLEELEKILKRNKPKACVAVPNFNNPLGSCMPDENKKKLVEILARYDTALIEDDIYGELYFGKNRPKTCKHYDKKGLVMHCSSLSKSLAPGYRIGWAIPGMFIEQVKEQKRINNISSPSLTQAAMAHFLRNGRYEYHLKSLRKALHTQHLRYVQAIINYFPAGTKVSRPQGGFTLWVELHKSVDSFRLRAEAMKHNISIVPGKIFSSGNHYSNYIRISFGKPWDEDMDYGLMMLGKIIMKMVKKH